MDSRYLIFLLVSVTVLLYFLYSKSKVYVKSNIDNRYYQVKDNVLKQDSADLLAKVNKNILALIKHIENLDTKPAYFKNLRKFDPDNIHENVINFDTTYTLDKGRFIAFCLGPRNSDKLSLYDINTMMYVAIHELGHVVSNSTGHNNEFKRNFSDLLRKAINIGIYQYVDYSISPVDYCGISLTKNILKKT